MLAAAAVAWACSAGGGGTVTGRPAPSPSRNPNIITADELSRVSATSLDEAVRTLRPQWLRNAPSTIRPEAEGTVVVYQDRVRLGGPESLRQINPLQVKEVRYYAPSEAELRFGPGHLHGAIEVTSITGR
ncbi:MAG: hypothetical protein AUH42_02465 [Gemmatimonadetes bacterium 13_1_40CM_70_11]|nr:MAG: hypothetical protein AUH42_02465 [Gemmatimonadetes bacterium 13_1_40CM_70_11]